MSGRVTICCVALFLFLSPVSAVQRIYSINDLHRSVSEHSLVLLRWFANAIEIDSNDYIWLNFDPNQGDYGSHHYGNYEQLLNRPTQGHRYYTIGNIYQSCSVKLPPAVINHADMGRNRARIIVSVQGPNAGRRRQRIDRVYITQHYEANQHGGNMREYDPYHTYQISTNLLRDMRKNRWINVVLICVVILVLLAFLFSLPNPPQTKSRWYL